jgi:predicted small metal-binding protein
MSGFMRRPREEARMSKQISCNDVVSGCGFTATAATEEELLAKTAAHACESHGVKEITPELAAKVKSAIKDR